MNALGFAFTAVLCVLMLALPRRWAALALLAAAALVPREQLIYIGPASFTVVRLVVAVGLLRLLVRAERPAHGLIDLDRLMLLWAGCLIATAAFHSEEAWMFRAGIVWSDLGTYILLRCLLHDAKDVERLFRGICWILIPLAVSMLIEKRTGMNPLSLLGASAYSAVRDGKIRATGPFGHAILAGTVGAACLPMAMYLWRSHRFAALAGIGSCLGIVYASTSSGPVLMLLAVTGGMLLLRWRRLVPAMRLVAAAGVIALAAVMKDPWYFVIARIDITGSSTGWHRSQLIRSWLDHAGEWVVAGTDYTRHWMPTGLRITSDHTDITNHFIQQAVWGGLPLLTVFVLLLWAAFARVGRELRSADADADADADAASKEEVTDVVPVGGEDPGPRHAPVALTWMAGVLLFGHVLNFVAISLFDQSSVFFFLVLAMVGAVAPDAPCEDVLAEGDDAGRATRPRAGPALAARSMRP